MSLPRPKCLELLLVIESMFTSVMMEMSFTMSFFQTIELVMLCLL